MKSSIQLPPIVTMHFYNFLLHRRKISYFNIDCLQCNLYSVILQKEYTSLKLRELEGLPRFGVMSWQPF